MPNNMACTIEPLLIPHLTLDFYEILLYYL